MSGAEVTYVQTMTDDGFKVRPRLGVNRRDYYQWLASDEMQEAFEAWVLARASLAREEKP